MSLLVSLPLTNTVTRNAQGKTPAEVVGDKAKTLSPEAKAKIEQLLAGAVYSIITHVCILSFVS